MAQPCVMRGRTPGNCSGSRRVGPEDAHAERRCDHQRTNELSPDPLSYDALPFLLPPPW